MSYDPSAFSADLAVETSEEREFRVWAEQLGITPDALRHAVSQVGNSAEAVRHFVHRCSQSARAA